MQLLKLRYLQIRRDLSYWVLLIAALLFFISQWVSAVSDLYCAGLAATALFLLVNFHLRRRDLNFLNKYFESPGRDIFINYNLLVLPISAGMLANGHWLIAVCFQGLSGCIAFLRLSSSGPKLVFLNKYLPAEQFEWIAGTRNYFYALLLLFVLGAVLSPVKFFGVVALFLFNSIFLSFYAFFEPLVMLNPANRNPEEFLKRKIHFASKFLLISNLPLLLVNSFFHPDVAWFNVSFVVGFLILISCTIYMKYENYKPNEELVFQVDTLFLFASALIPFLLPIAFYLNYSHRKKALQNLSHYTDA